MSGRRNCYIDILKGIACVGVVFMHCEFPGIIGTMVQAIARWAVPLFFTVSGYFCEGSNIQTIKRRLVYIGKLTLGACVLYMLLALLENYKNILVFFHSELTLVNIGAFVLVNSPIIVNGHLWFLFALIYVYVIYGIMVSKKWVEKTYILIPILLILHFGIAYGSYFLGKSIKAGFYRNWLLEGLPFFLLGSWFRGRQSWIEEKIAHKSKSLLLVVGIFSVFLVMVERVAIGRDFSLHLCSIVTLIVFFVYSILSFEQTEVEGVSKVLCKWGGYSKAIYIIHPAVFKLWDVIFQIIGCSQLVVIQWIRPVNTLVWSAVLAMLYEWMRKRRRT